MCISSEYLILLKRIVILQLIPMYYLIAVENFPLKNTDVYCCRIIF